MSINSVTPQAIANHRQVVDPKKSELKSSHRSARKSNDDRKCDMAITALESLDVDSKDYFDELYDEGDLH